MKKCIGGITIFIIACNSSEKNLIYEDSTNKFYVKTEESKKGALVDTLYKFYDINKPSEIKETGFYKDGFQNDLWSYNLPKEVKTIKWGYYKDKYLNFETNLFQEVDSIKHGGFFSNFLFNTESGKIVLTVSINGPFKDSLPARNYERITKQEFFEMGATPLSFTTETLTYAAAHIYINQIAVKTSANAIKYIKGCFGFIDKQEFVEISVSSSVENNFYADELFNAVLTHFVINGKHLYNPFKKEDRLCF